MMTRKIYFKLYDCIESMFKVDPDLPISYKISTWFKCLSLFVCSNENMCDCHLWLEWLVSIIFPIIFNGFPHKSLYYCLWFAILVTYFNMVSKSKLWDWLCSWCSSCQFQQAKRLSLLYGRSWWLSSGVSFDNNWNIIATVDNSDSLIKW